MDKSRSQEKIFADMHRELRAWNKDMPEAVERMDPVLRLMLQLYAHQLSQIDRRIDQTWEVSSESLLRSLVPECRRWAIPAHTVIHCRPSDPVLDVDTHTKMFYRERREGGETFYFAFHREHRMVKAEIKHFFVAGDEILVDQSPTPTTETRPPAPKQYQISGDKTNAAYLGITFTEHASNLEGATLFFNGDVDALQQIRWGDWYAGTANGTFDTQNAFVPGLTTFIDDLFRESGKPPVDWGGLRTTRDLYGHLEPHFVMIPRAFTSQWEVSPPGEELTRLLGKAGVTPPDSGTPIYWIKIALPERGKRQSFQPRVSGRFNCFVATNRNEQTLFKHTGGNRLVEMVLPEPLNTVLSVDKVVDSASKEYVPRYEIEKQSDQKTYAVEERDDKLVLWFEYPSTLELPPDSLTVTYSTTAADRANGISEGEIVDLYESHPGIESVVNVLPVKSGVPAKTPEQILTEVSVRLRARDRALGFRQIARWVTTFDPRITSVECENGVQRAERGVVRCIVVKTYVRKADFYSTDETSLMQIRINQFLKSRSPVNTRYQVEIIEQ